MDLQSAYDLDQVAETDVWDCGMCHSDIEDPAASLGAQSPLYQRVAGSLSELDAKSSVCAQCHAGVGTWMTSKNASGANLDDESVVIGPYKYGYDPASLFKVLDETADENAKQHLDPENGIWTYINCTEPHIVEAYQGSVMEQLGLDCADCHMPTITATDGSTYTSHDASGNILDSQVALEECLTCHNAQGLTTVAGVIAYTNEGQAKYEEARAATAAELQTLLDAIYAAIDAGVDEDTLDQARRAYAEAYFYQGYCNTVTYVHNPVALMNYLEQESAIIAEGLALLS